MDAVSVYAPGTVSNLGPGFDCLGIAFTGKGDTVTARRVGASGIRVASVSDPRIPTDPERNTAAIAAAAILRRAGSDAGLELEIAKGLPVAGGMGGSAASAVAGAVAAAAVIEARLSQMDLLGAALEAEAAVAGFHADNIAPSLMGGAILVRGLDPPQFTQIKVHPTVALVLVTPEYTVETAKARAVLPRDLLRADAIAQAACLAGLVLGLERGDGDLIRDCMVDRIAEPVRKPLYPGYDEARAAAMKAGAWGVAVSGAGPTLIALAHWGVAGAVGQAMVEAYGKLGMAAAAHPAEVDRPGARVVT